MLRLRDRDVEEEGAKKDEPQFIAITGGRQSQAELVAFAAPLSPRCVASVRG
jgi:hypothetical protein